MAVYRLWRREDLWQIFRDAMRESVMIMMIIAAADLFSYMMSTLFITQTLAMQIADLEVNRWLVMLWINVFLLVAGCFLPPVAIILMTAPTLLPIIEGLGFDAIWFGIILTINMEIGLITPPVGLNLYVINGIAPDVPLQTILWGALPFVLCMVLAIVILCLFPQIALWLPEVPHDGPVRRRDVLEQGNADCDHDSGGGSLATVGKRLAYLDVASVRPGECAMSRTVWLEVALNGPWGRTLQPGMPITVGELVADGIACARAGAAIVHVHAYDERTGRQRDDAETYRRIIEGIREQEDVIVYPTLPVMGGPDAPRAMTAPERFKAVEQLAMQGLLEWTVVDPGSVNFAHHDRLAANQEGFVYLNPEGHVRYGLELAARYRLPPQLRDLRAGFSANRRRARPRLRRAPPPVYRFMFSDGFAFGFPPKAYGLEAYLRLLADEAPGAPWMIAGLAVDIRRLIPAAVAHGGHVRVGLEDAPLGTATTNVAVGRAGRRGHRERRRPRRHRHRGAGDTRADLGRRTPAPLN